MKQSVPALVISPNGDIRIENPWPALEKIECGDDGGCTLTPQPVLGVARDPVIVRRQSASSEIAQWYTARTDITVASNRGARCSEAQIAARQALLNTEKRHSVNWIAGKTGIEQSSLSRWKSGRTSLRSENVHLLAEHFGIAPEEIPNDQKA